MDQQQLKAIKLKTNILKRNIKELHSYQKEVEVELKRLSKLQEGENDEHRVNYQKKVIIETKSMIPECHKRVLDAYRDLQQLIPSFEANDTLMETEEFKAAKEVLSQLPPLVGSC